MSKKQKPTGREIRKAIQACQAAGCDMSKPYWELSEEAKAAWRKHMGVIIAAAGEPTPEQLQAARERVKSQLARRN